MNYSSSSSSSSSSQAPKHLDPSAQEFHPTPTLTPLQTSFFLTPPPPPLTAIFPPLPPPPTHLFLPYLAPPPLPPPTTYFQLIPSPLPPPPTLLQPTTTNSPSRTLLLTSIPPYATEHSIKTELDSFGEIRAVEMERALEGIVTVHFFDLQDAQNALREIRAQHFAGCPVWAQFLIPDVLQSVCDPLNHGTIVVFNLDPHISDHTLKRIFQAFGPVKEVRETPTKRNQKFVEYFDVRHAAKAATEMNGKVLHGKQITIDFSRPGGGHGRRWRTETDDFQQSKLRQSQSTPASRKPATRNIYTKTDDNATIAVPRSQQQQQVCVARRPTTTTTATSDVINGRNGGTNATVEDSMSSSGNVNSQNDSVLDKNVVRSKVAVNKQRVGKGKSRHLDLRFMIKEDVITGCGDSRTTLMIKNIPNKYSQKLLLSLLDNHCAHCNDQILSGHGGVGGRCLSSYDFVYLPMDFNNKCNVGYGFVNMTSPEATMRLYKAFHRQSWEVFNSRKICEVTYARVQGLEALKEHFRSSKFPTGSDEIFPVVFQPPRDGRLQLTPPQPVYGLSTTTGSSENGSSSSCSRSTDEQSQECSQLHSQGSVDCVNEVFLKLRVVGDVTEVEQSGGVDEVDNHVDEEKEKQ